MAARLCLGQRAVSVPQKKNLRLNIFNICQCSVGICDPWDSPKCMEKSIASPKYSTQAMWLKDMCKADGLQCPALNDKGRSVMPTMTGLV